jgi:hypothetical protein
MSVLLKGILNVSYPQFWFPASDFRLPASSFHPYAACTQQLALYQMWIITSRDNLRLSEKALILKKVIQLSQILYD